MKRWVFDDITLTYEQTERAIRYGLKQSTVRKRILVLGWDEDRAVSTPPRAFKPIWTEQDMKEARENEIGKDTFRMRINNGWSVEDAKTKPVLRRGVQNGSKGDS